MANAPITVGELADVPAPGSSVASAFHVEVANRVVQRFATPADLAARWPAATAGKGALAVTVDKVALWQSNGTAWVPVGAGGVVAAAYRTDAQNGIFGVADILSVVFNTYAGRRYRAEFNCRNYMSAGGSTVDAMLTDGANNAVQTYTYSPPAGWLNTTGWYTWNGVTGSTQLKFRLQCSPGVINTAPGTVVPVQLLVEDIGPA